jgi:hypothetical protein
MERWKEAQGQVVGQSSKNLSEEEWTRRCREIEEVRMQEELHQREKERIEWEETKRMTWVQCFLRWYSGSFLPPVVDAVERPARASYLGYGLFSLICGLSFLLAWRGESELRAALHRNLWVASAYFGSMGWLGINCILWGLKYLDAYRRAIYVQDQAR